MMTLTRQGLRWKGCDAQRKRVRIWMVFSGSQPTKTAGSSSQRCAGHGERDAEDATMGLWWFSEAKKKLGGEVR